MKLIKMPVNSAILIAKDHTLCFTDTTLLVEVQAGHCDLPISPSVDFEMMFSIGIILTAAQYTDHPIIDRDARVSLV